MAGRAIWKADLRIGTIAVPIKLYSAVVDRTIRFHILDEKKERVKQHMVEPENGQEVPSAEIVKGFEFEKGKFVVLTEEELKELEPEASREVQLAGFVSAGDIGPQWYDRPYWLGPDGDSTGYFALAEALANRRKEGLAHWVMRKKAYVGALRAEGDYLSLVTLRNAEEVVAAKELPSVRVSLSQKEINLGKQLVELLEGEFDPAAFKNEYRARLTEFIESKSRGKAPRLHLVKSKRASTSLDSTLAKSIAALKKEKTAA
jgi:DNA end-binding protein Ku